MSNRAALGVIFLVVFLDVLAFALLVPLIPVWAQRFTLNPYIIASLMSAYSLAQFLCAPVWGSLSDRFGRRKLLLISLLGEAVAFALMPFSTSMAALYGARVMQGIFGAGIIALVPAFVADVTSPEDRSRGMGAIGAAMGLGFVFGPGLGAVISKVDMQLPFFIAAGICLLNLLFATAVLPESLKRNGHEEHQHTGAMGLSGLGRALAQPVLGLLLILLAVNTFAFSNMSSTFTLYVQAHFRLSEEGAIFSSGILLAYVGIVAVIVQGGLIGVLTQKYGEARLLAAGLFFTALGMALVPSSQTTLNILIPLTFISAGFGLAGPSITSLISRNAGLLHQGGVLGTSQGLASLSRVFGPQWGGWTFAYLGIHWPFWTAGVIIGLCFLVALMRMSTLHLDLPQADTTDPVMNQERRSEG